jgi:hypothetical protein
LIFFWLGKARTVGGREVKSFRLQSGIAVTLVLVKVLFQSLYFWSTLDLHFSNIAAAIELFGILLKTISARMSY